MDRDELIENLRTTLLWETVCAHIEHGNEAHYELLEETRKEIKNIRFFREDVERHIEIPELNDIEFPIDEVSVSEETYGEIQLCEKSRWLESNPTPQD